MGSKKKKTTVTKTTTVNTKVIKLTYLQTLAVSQNLLKPEELETDSKVNIPISASSSSSFLGKNKKKTSATADTTGLKLKDSWFQPYFDKIRYTIGIRELTAAKYTFAETSEFVSVPFLSPKEVIKVHAIVDEYIPPQFDTNLVWIKYYIKPEGTDEWIQINPLNAPTRFDAAGDIIPKIINFNLPKPSIVASENKFNYTSEPVKKIRFRAVLSRPLDSNSASITPLLKSYRMIMSPRES